jgi:hypothetical protein
MHNEALQTKKHVKSPIEEEDLYFAEYILRLAIQLREKGEGANTDDRGTM